VLWISRSTILEAIEVLETSTFSSVVEKSILSSTLSLFPYFLEDSITSNLNSSLTGVGLKNGITNEDFSVLDWCFILKFSLISQSADLLSAVIEFNGKR